jgi:hypothetical protein
VFTAQKDEILSAVNFFTCKNNVDYQVRIFDKYENGNLQEELSSVTGHIDFRGFHTIDLAELVFLTNEDEFYIYLKLAVGGIPYDRTHNVWGNTIESISHPGESYYYENGKWHDLYDFDDSANFCIKGLTIEKDTIPPDVWISKPKNAIYINDEEITPFFTPLIIGPIQIWPHAVDNGSGLAHLELYINDVLIETFTSVPKSWTWSEKVFGKRTIKLVAHDNAEYNSSIQITVWKFF